MFLSHNSNSVVCSSWYGNEFVRIDLYILSQYMGTGSQQATKDAPKHTHKDRCISEC